MSIPNEIDAVTLTRLIRSGMVIGTTQFKLPKPPRYRRMREVHAQRARKLRRRGEYVHFLRWHHGHCIYGWGGPTPDTFTFRMHPAVQHSGDQHGR
jgi:hypothetical protein